MSRRTLSTPTAAILSASSFVNGIANSTTVKDYKAETTQITVTDGSDREVDSGTRHVHRRAAGAQPLCVDGSAEREPDGGVAFDS